MNSALLTHMLLLCICTLTFAQGGGVSGKVVDKSSGVSLPGVNIIIKGTTQGTTTDKNGQYTLAVPDPNAVLVFSFIGFKTIEKVVGGATNIDAEMIEDVVNLGEGAVVTGLAIERQKRSIGYGISQVSGKDVTIAQESNIINSLQGKVTGVLITQTGGGLGASSKIVIRGMTSLSGNNPLWVVDGVPIFNEQEVTGGNRVVGDVGVRDFFNGAAVVNPDNVESISVLKGAAATALYGSRAAAGVILVTTKKGLARFDGLLRPQIEISSSTRFDWLFKAPDMQYEYSGGNTGGKYRPDAVSAWGEPIQGQIVTLPVLFREGPLRAYKKNYYDFYQLGKTLINNVSVSDANDKFNYRFGVSSLNQEGILPNSTLNRISVSVNAGGKLANWITTQFSVQYIWTEIPNTGASGDNDPSVVSWNSFTPTTNFRYLRPWENALGEQASKQGSQRNYTYNNPLWVRYKNKNGDANHRIITSLTHIFTLTEGLNITSRLGYDFEKDKRLFINERGTESAFSGYFTVSASQRRQLNWDGIVDYSRKIGRVQIKGLAGFNYNSRVTETEGLYSNTPFLRQVFAPLYGSASTPTRSYSQSRLMGVYGQVEASYNNWLTLTVSGRNDWTSTLSKGSNSYFYPSVSVAFVFTDAFRIASRGLSFGKLRGSWAQVGRDTAPYALSLIYNPESQIIGSSGTRISFPFQDYQGLSRATTEPPRNLQPQRQTSWEVGTELSFLDNRIELDVTYYSSENNNQIVSMPIPESTGFGSVTVNRGAIESSGLEITLRSLVLDLKNFRWNTTVNFTTNRTRAYNLGSKVTAVQQARGVSVVVVDGGTWELQGDKWARDPTSGRPLINPNTGQRQLGGTELFGPIQPAATWGFTNTFSIASGLSLSVTIDGRIGGKLYSGTLSRLWYGGLVVETAKNRKGTYLDRDGVIATTNQDGVITSVRDNDVPVRSVEDFWKQIDGQKQLGEPVIFDATFIKLREVGLSYSLPRKWLSKTPFTTVSIGVEGRNLLLLYSKIPHIDPEVNSFGAGATGGGGVEYNAVPTTRSFGFNVKLKF